MSDPVRAAQWSGSSYARHSAHHRAVDEWFLARNPPAPTDVVVDLGCGTGEFSARLSALVPHGRVIGVDGDSSMLTTAQRHSAANLTFLQSAAEHVDEVITHASVDLVVSRAMLHWLPISAYPRAGRAFRFSTNVRHARKPLSRHSVKRIVIGITRNTTGTIIAISRRPPASSNARFPASRTSAACARSTSASGVPRSMATDIPSANRASGARLVRPAMPSRACTRVAPVRASISARLSSRASSPLLVRATRSNAPTGPSPAETDRASRSAIVGNSARIRASRSRTCRDNARSRASTPATPAATLKTSIAMTEWACLARAG